MAVSLRDVCTPFEIYDVRQGIKVGVIGLGNQDTLLSAYEGGNSLGIPPDRQRDRARSVRPRFLRPYVDLVVVVEPPRPR